MVSADIKTKFLLTDEEIEEVFQYQLFEHTVEDARNHIREFVDFMELNKTEEDNLYSYARDMADKFLYKYKSCELADNDVWYEIVKDYYWEKVHGRK